MATQSVVVRDFPGMTLGDALKIGTHRLAQEGYEDIEPMPTEGSGGRLLAIGVPRRGPASDVRHPRALIT
jgi:hypothetical protein